MKPVFMLGTLLLSCLLFVSTPSKAEVPENECKGRMMSRGDSPRDKILSGYKGVILIITDKRAIAPETKNEILSETFTQRREMLFAKLESEFRAAIKRLHCDSLPVQVVRARYYNSRTENQRPDILYYNVIFSFEINKEHPEKSTLTVRPELYRLKKKRHADKPNATFNATYISEDFKQIKPLTAPLYDSQAEKALSTMTAFLEIYIASWHKIIIKQFQLEEAESERLFQESLRDH